MLGFVERQCEKLVMVLGRLRSKDHKLKADLDLVYVAINLPQ